MHIELRIRYIDEEKESDEEHSVSDKEMIGNEEQERESKGERGNEMIG